MPNIRLRDGYAVINGDDSVIEMPSDTIQILADKDTLISVRLQKDGTILISSGGVCRHNGGTVDDTLLIKPISSTKIEITRPRYQGE